MGLDGFQKFCILVIWIKVAPSLEGLNPMLLETYLTRNPTATDPSRCRGRCGSHCVSLINLAHSNGSLRWYRCERQIKSTIFGKQQKRKFKKMFFCCFWETVDFFFCCFGKTVKKNIFFCRSHLHHRICNNVDWSEFNFCRESQI